MTIKEFLGSNDTLEQHIVRDYASFEEKESMAKGIAKQSYYVDGVFKRMSTVRYVLEKMALLKLYTDLEYGDDVIESYDLFQSTGYFKLLQEKLNAEELNEFKTIVKMECEDTEFNEYEPHAYIQGQVERFGELIATSLESLAPVLENINWDELTKKIE